MIQVFQEVITQFDKIESIIDGQFHLNVLVSIGIYLYSSKVKSLSHVQLLATPWTAAFQAPLPMGFFQARVLEWGAIAFSDSTC